MEDGFLEPGGGGGGFLPIGGGGPFLGKLGALEVPGSDGLPGIGGAAAAGGLGTDLGNVSESERYEESRLAAGRSDMWNRKDNACLLLTPCVNAPTRLPELRHAAGEQTG